MKGRFALRSLDGTTEIAVEACPICMALVPVEQAQTHLFALHREEWEKKVDSIFDLNTPNGECCMADHAKAVPPWTCPCPCHRKGTE